MPARRMGHRRLAAAAAAVLLAGCGGGGEETADQPGAAAGSVTASPMAGMAGMAGMSASAMAAMNGGDGLSKSQDGYTLTDLKAPKKVGAGTLSFRIEGPSGKPHTEFAQIATKLLHLYVVRKDLTEYQHIHPSLDTATGTWTVPITMAEPGPYHLIAEFEALTPERDFDDRKLGEDFTVDGSYTPESPGPGSAKGTVDGYEVAITGAPKVHGENLQLAFTKDGKDVTDLRPYLEAFAHVTAFREGDLASVHVHPNENPPKGDEAARGGPDFTLVQTFANPGRYRLFVEFQAGDSLRIATLDLDVA